MRLTRRQAIATVLSGGIVAGGGLRSGVAGRDAARSTSEALTGQEMRVVTAVAAVVYPADVSSPESILDGYLHYQPPDRLAEIQGAVRALDREAGRRYGESFAALSPGERETLLRELGVDRVGSDPDGTVPERVRHYLVDGALFALFTDASGGALLGVDNPRGYPGGYEYATTLESEDA